MALKCKKCKKVTKKKKNVTSSHRSRCRGCGGFDFEEVADAFVVEFDYDDTLDFGMPGYDAFDEGVAEVYEEGPVDVVEDRFAAENQPCKSDYDPPEEKTMHSNFGNSFGGGSTNEETSYSSPAYESSSSDDCGGGGCDD